MARIQIADIEKSCCSWNDIQQLKLNGVKIGNKFNAKIDKETGAVHFIKNMKHCTAWLNVSCKLIN